MTDVLLNGRNDSLGFVWIIHFSIQWNSPSIPLGTKIVPMVRTYTSTLKGSELCRYTYLSWALTGTKSLKNLALHLPPNSPVLLLRFYTLLSSLAS